MQPRWSIRVLFAFVAFFPHDIAAAQTLKIPYVSISGFQAPLYLGERAGLFKKNQLEAQLIYMPGGGTAQGGSSGSRLFQVYRPMMSCE